ncbi:MAG TPA: hypothetical protein VEA78_08475, partial [Acidimicrobiales bacterium]|nr:hypothetical protein [Acidimicrobiales bacterium]
HEAQEQLGGPWYAGWASILVGFAWWTGAAVSMVGSLLTRGAIRTGFVAAAGISALLGLDDVLMLHDRVLHELGVRELMSQVGYLVLYAAYAWLARSTWQRHGWHGLALVVVLLGGSIAGDRVLQKVIGTELTVVEDGLKLVGACVWAAVQTHFVVAESTLALARREDPDDSLRLPVGIAVGGRQHELG